MEVSIDIDLLTRQLVTLASFSDVPAPAVTRIVFSENDRRARNYLKALFAEAGLEVREDAIGNTFALWKGTEPSLAPVATGSHVDAIPNSGMYDGTIGVLGGLASILSLQSSGYRPKRSIELLMFTAEEPTRFGIGCLGSRMLSGTLTPESAKSLRDGGGNSLEEVRGNAGFKGDLECVRCLPGSYAAFVELHIEQGPLLEKEGLSIGVVTDIAAPASLKMTITGEGGHAGTVLMLERKDAFLAAAEIALAVERSAKATGSQDSVATVGVCEVFPGAVNSIPSRVKIELDIRDTDGERRDQMLKAILTSSGEIAIRRGVSIDTELLNADDPARADASIVNAITDSCRSLTLRHRMMVSRAYHDTLFMAQIAPVGMIFVPCRNGVSHRPDEYCSPREIEAGVNVLAQTLIRLTNGL
jgi:ureidoglycolate amidohydrolase